MVLLKLFLKLDFRNSRDSGMGKLAGMVLTYLFINSMISLGNFQRFDLNVFMFSALTVNLFLVGFVVVSDFAELFFSSSYSSALKTLPVSESGIFVSKMVSALAYLSVYPFIVSLPPAVYVYFYNTSIAESLTFLLVSFLFSYFIIGLIFLLNSFVIIRSKTRSKTLAFVLQILFIAFIFSLNKYSSSAGENLLTLSYVKFLPQYYLLLGFYQHLYLLAFVAVTVGLFAFIYYFLRNNYFSISYFINSSAAPTERKRLFNLNLDWLENLFLKNSTEKASFYLVKNHFRNTSVLKLRMVPVLFLPVVAALVTVFSGMGEVVFISDISETAVLILNPAVSMALVISSGILLSNLAVGFEEDSNISSLYASLPISGRNRFKNGVRKFITLYFLLPLFALCGIIVAFKSSSADVFYNFVFVFMFIQLVNTLTARLEKDLPFSKPPSKFGGASKYSRLFISLLSGILLIAAQIFIFRNFIFFIISIFVILSITVLINKIPE